MTGVTWRASLAFGLDPVRMRSLALVPRGSNTYGVSCGVAERRMGALTRPRYLTGRDGPAGLAPGAPGGITWML